MSDLTAEEFARLMAQVSPKGGKKTVARTLEEAIGGEMAPLDESIAPQKEGEVLPIPSPDMTLRQLAQLMEKYEHVVSEGAYLALWTDLKGTPNESVDPETEGRRHMTGEEERAYDWFKESGDQNEFDWKLSRLPGSTPEHKRRVLHQQILALRLMYANDTLNAENLYWIRKERTHHFKIVLAYAKVLKAANDIRQGQRKGSVLDYKEYQTCNRIIGESGENVNNTLKEIRELTTRIEEANQIVLARRLVVARKCGIDLKAEGSAVRGARELGRQIPGRITAPSKAPAGRRTVRETLQTLEELRSMSITSGMQVEELPKIAATGLVARPRKRVRTSGKEREEEGGLSGSKADDDETEEEDVMEEL
jgi:hypothetical protein